ncbi:MATE family efflux transporter [Pajaroellobacter abortibovis]|uniref:MATE family efflux transporter n=1 Tax=Pajaroellobacter abortibovis TaxID=1882918 RepID=UPI0012EC4114|nr:MATE family efflux transporter [Pajaroellobacter abortibovis]
MNSISYSCPTGSVSESQRYRIILRLATPTVIAMLSQSIVNEIDVFFFSKLPCHESSNAQAALLPSLITFWLFGGSLSAITVGTQALTARRYAEGNWKKAGHILTNATFFCLFAGTLGSLLGILFVSDLLQMMIKVPEVWTIAVAYSRWRILGILSMLLTMAIKAFFDGIGRAHVHMIAAIVMNICNVLFCWMFVYGQWGAPRMGAPGAGLSAFLATWIGLFVMLFYTFSARKEFSLFHFHHIKRKTILELLRLSAPAAVATVALMGGFGLFSTVVGRLDHNQPTVSISIAEESTCGVKEAVNSAATTDIAAVLKLTLTACIAFGTATATLVSQSLGAKRPDEAKHYGWASVRLGLLLFGFIGVCEGILFTPSVVHFITQSEAVQKAAMLPMRLMGVMTPFIAVAMILSEALFGAGNTRFVALAQLTMVFGCLVPLSFLLGLHLQLGLLGVWLSAAIYSLIASITMAIKFRRGSWQHITL